MGYHSGQVLIKTRSVRSKLSVKSLSMSISHSCCRYLISAQSPLLLWDLSQQLNPPTGVIPHIVKGPSFEEPPVLPLQVAMVTVPYVPGVDFLWQWWHSRCWNINYLLYKQGWSVSEVRTFLWNREWSLCWKSCIWPCRFMNGWMCWIRNLICPVYVRRYNSHARLYWLLEIIAV